MEAFGCETFSAIARSDHILDGRIQMLVMTCEGVPAVVHLAQFNEGLLPNCTKLEVKVAKKEAV
jgi:hypothetical protein